MVQQLRKSITALVFFVAFGAAAQPVQPPLVLRPDAPDRYIVVPGDTLWGISSRYTDSPWRWPELWGMNREHIQNPHLIYPGMVLLLDRASGRLTIAVPGDPGGKMVMPGTVRLSPRQRAEPLAKQEIPAIPPSAIEAFLTRPLVIEPDGLKRAPIIVGTQQDRVILSEGNTAYVRGIGESSEQTWYVFRRGVPLVDPDTHQVLAYEAIYLATAQVTRRGEPATVLLTSAVQEVNVGDALVAAGRAPALNYVPHPPSVHLTGRVIGIYGGVSRVGEAGQLQIISVNRGRADGVEVGHVLALYSQGGTVRDVTKAFDAPDARIQLPDERAGLAFVFRVFERVSYGLIMQITMPVRPLDVVRAP